ncbi:hypothetical protein [Paenarthrobacter nicotinovorans]|uniref:hypothetical protein n=1 Tax=Paenarthrobacter nicotinovorans TaxID=29320 RepID=UPI003D67177D
MSKARPDTVRTGAMGDLLANVFMILPNNGDTALSLWCCGAVVLSDSDAVLLLYCCVAVL